MKRSRPPLPAVVAIEVQPGRPLHFATGRKQQLVLQPAAVAAMMKHRQVRGDDAEAGGMLFAQISPLEISVEEVTKPQHVDRRSRFGFWPCNSTQQQMINKQFKRGLHFVGEWHTHPEPCPSPSGLDLASMEKCFLKSRHELKALVMVILGTDKSPTGFWVSLHNRQGCRPLKLVGC